MTKPPEDDETRVEGYVPPAPGPPAGGLVIPGGLEPGAKLGARYEILAVLGQGGMGAVYKALDLELDRTVALKVIRPEMAAQPAIIDRFKREILLASKVTHRNVIRLYDLGEADGVRFISMAFVEGETLKSLCEREGALSVERAVPIVRELLEALQAAHEAGVVHRDLKPQNVMVDSEGHAYIADFGISHSMDSGDAMTRTGMLLGTVDYMSPEQARGEHPDARSDIYSFGLILYEIFAGRPPFEAGTALSALVQRIEGNVPTIKLARPDLPSWMAAVISRSLKREPADRYQSAAEMLADINTRHASIAWKRRFRPQVLVPAILAVAVAVAGIAWGVKAWRARAEAVGAQAAAIPGGARSVPAYPPVASLLVLPVTNSTGDAAFAWARTGLAELLATGLAQTPQVRVVGADKATELMASLNMRDEDLARPAEMRKLAGLLNVDRILVASLFKAGPSFQLNAKVHQVGAGSFVEGSPIKIEGKGDDALFSMVDDLSSKVLGELGLRNPKDRRGAGDISTTSVAALKEYSEGVALVREGNNLDAVGKFESAVQADTGFALANAALAETYDRLGMAEKASGAAEKAVAGLGRTSPQEAARIRGVRARIAGDLEAAEVAFLAECMASPSDPSAWQRLAGVQEEAGDLESALISMRRAVDLDAKNPSAQLSLGRVLVKLGEAEEGLAKLTTARDLQEASGNKEGLSSALNGIGNVYLNSFGEPDKALEQYQRALEIRQALGDRRGVAVVLGNIGTVQIKKAKYADAIATMLEAKRLWEELGDQAGLAMAWGNLGDAYDSAGQPEQALDAFREGLRITGASNDVAGQARTESSLGSIYTTQGSYGEARHWQEQALAKRRQIGDKREIVRSLSDIGVTEQFLGRYDDALKHNLEGRELVKELGDKSAEISFSINIADIQADQGNYSAALAGLAEAEAAAREKGNQDLLPYAVAYRAGTLARLGDYAAAAAAFADAEPLVRGSDNPALLAEMHCLRAGMLLAQGSQKTASPLIKEARRLAESSRDHRLTLTARLLDARVRGSERDIQAVIADAKKSGLAPLVAPGYLALARLAADARPARMNDVVVAAEQSALAARPLGQADLLFQARALLVQPGREATGAVPGTRLQDALDALEALRAGMKKELSGAFLNRADLKGFLLAAEVAAGHDGGEAASRLRRLTTP